jgi:TatD DNase family protein
MNDAHTHLTTSPLKEVAPRAVEEFISKGGKKLMNVAYDMESIREVLSFYNEYDHKFPNVLQNAFGIHPEIFNPDTTFNRIENHEDLQKLLNKFEEYVNQNLSRTHAIGETGLEYYHLLDRHDIQQEEKETCIELQKASLRKHIEIAKKNNLPMTIHIRDEQGYTLCFQDAFGIFADEGKGVVKACLHSYTGDLQFLKDFLDLGFYIGYNAIITYKSGENVRQALKETPMERILLETDAPFLPPQSIRSDRKSIRKYATPVDILEIAKMVADIKNLSLPEVLNTSLQNHKELFNS